MTVFITGATSGIGRACAEKFAAEHHNLFITGRRKELLEEVAADLEQRYKISVETLCFDVQDREAVFAVIDDLEDGVEVDILINNAGLALGRDPFDKASLDDWDTMLATNVNGLLYVSKALLPKLIRSKGHVVNIGSTAGREVYESGNVYCASKFAVDAISKAMRLDLLPHQIRVTSINPGAVETEFSRVRFKGDEAKAEAVYNGFEALTPEDIADVIFYCCSLPPRVCVNDLTLTALQQANSFTILRNPAD